MGGHKRPERKARPLKTCDQIHQWLRDNKLFDLFNVNLGQYGKSLTAYTKRNNGPYFIMCAFVWSRTIQGGRFWFAVHKRFQKWYGKVT